MKKLKMLMLFLLLLFFLWAANTDLSAQGHFEFDFHYGSWNINLLKSIIEDGVGDALETNILEKIQEDYPDMDKMTYSQVVKFDSSGNNYGFGIRWYPGGQSGSFSLGFSVEKTTMKIGFPTVSANLGLTQGASFQGNASGEFIINPLSFHLSFRWEVKPSWRIHPYFAFGFGAATGTALEEADISYSYTGDLSIPGELPEHYTKTEKKTLKELKEQIEAEGEEFFLPGFIPFIQLTSGIKGKITKFLHAFAEAGIWNGFIVRGGIAFRI